MNGKVIEKRINRNIDRVRRDIAALGDDATTELNRRFELLTDGPRKKAEVAIKDMNRSIGQMNKSIGRGLNQYNAKIQDAVDKVPGDLGKKVTGYPWVAVTMSMVLGLVLGAVLGFSRHIS